MTKKSDYAGRLRGWIGHPACPAQAVQDDLRAGADEIERLQKDLRRANAALVRHGVEEMRAGNASAEPSGCPEHGMEHFFEGMCIKCGVVPPAKSGEPIICDRCGQDIAGKMIHECDGIL